MQRSDLIGKTWVWEDSPGCEVLLFKVEIMGEGDTQTFISNSRYVLSHHQECDSSEGRGTFTLQSDTPTAGETTLVVNIPNQVSRQTDNGDVLGHKETSAVWTFRVITQDGKLALVYKADYAKDHGAGSPDGIILTQN